MKQITIDGRIGKDAEVLSTRGGKQYVRFSVANNTYANGTEKTEWFDVTSYDQFVIENRVKSLTKGRYVIVSGSLNSEIAVKEGKCYLNQYVTATSIDTPSLGAKREGGEEEQTQVSTFSTTKQTAKPKEEVKVASASGSFDIDVPF